MTKRVNVNPAMLRWAAERAGLGDGQLATWPKWRAWFDGAAQPTVQQARAFAKRTHIPFGVLLLDEPPEVDLPVADFRAGRGLSCRVSPQLLDTVYACQRGQDWYVDYARDEGAEPLGFPGSAGKGIGETAAAIATTLQFTVSARRRGKLRDATTALCYVADRFEKLGGLAMFNSVVGNNTHRTLSLEEVRGLSLNSDIAPLIFVNSADTKAGQLFSFFHECAHIWRGDSGVSVDISPDSRAGGGVEAWCNKVAAEVLVPADDLRAEGVRASALAEDAECLARERYLCSTLVVILAAKSAGLVDAERADRVFSSESARLAALASQAGKDGGDFYRLLPTRIGRTAYEAILRQVRGRATSYTEAMSLLDVRLGTLDRLLGRNESAA